jgi:uncharacterized integral membrane protein
MATLLSWSFDHPTAAILILIGIANLGGLIATYSVVRRSEYYNRRRRSEARTCLAGRKQDWVESAYLQHQR